jgi:hypothetical protein
MSRPPGVPPQLPGRSHVREFRFPAAPIVVVQPGTPNAAPIAAPTVKRNAVTTPAAMAPAMAKSSAVRTVLGCVTVSVCPVTDVAPPTIARPMSAPRCNAPPTILACTPRIARSAERKRAVSKVRSASKTALAARRPATAPPAVAMMAVAEPAHVLTTKSAIREAASAQRQRCCAPTESAGRAANTTTSQTNAHRPRAVTRVAGHVSDRTVRAPRRAPVVPGREAASSMASAEPAARITSAIPIPHRRDGARCTK